MAQQKTSKQGNIYPFPTDANSTNTQHPSIQKRNLESLAMAIGQSLNIALDADELIYWFKFGSEIKTNFDVIVEWLKQETISIAANEAELSFDCICEKFHSVLRKIAYDLGIVN